MPVYQEFDAIPPTEKMDYYLVGEGQLAVATYQPERPYIATMGLYTCKAVAIYDPFSKKGLLAHLSWSPDLKGSMKTIAESFGPEIDSADVHLVQSKQYDNPSFGWPDLDVVAAAVSRYNPRTISADTNRNDYIGRGIALGLRDGAIIEAEYTTMDEWSNSQDTSLSHPIQMLPN